MVTQRKAFAESSRSEERFPLRGENPAIALLEEHTGTLFSGDVVYDGP
jgi:hypothetical protein